LSSPFRARRRPTNTDLEAEGPPGVGGMRSTTGGQALHRALWASICPHVSFDGQITCGSRHKCGHNSRTALN
jgi:hypothetical protein